MAEGGRPQVYSIPAHRGFADALVAGLVPRYSDPELGLARLTLLLPSRRAERIITEAFVRQMQRGMLLPRIAVLGDLDPDDAPGMLFDPVAAADAIPPAADPLRRWLRLAELIKAGLGDDAPDGAGLLRLAQETGQTFDRLAVEGIELGDLLDQRIAGIVGELADHWQQSTRQFAQVLARWQTELAARGEVDLPQRRNLLFDRLASRWSAAPPAHPVIAAGITSASPAIGQLLRVVSRMPRGAVVLPDLDLMLGKQVWDSLGRAGVAPAPGEAPFGDSDAVTHPQYHLKLLLNRIDVARDEVQPWHRAGLSASPSDRSRAISNLFLPPAASASWVDLPADQRRLGGVRLMETAHPEEEAQAIAILVREALEVPERRVAVITPDQTLAARVAANLKRWDIAADDSSGRGLAETPAGRLLLQIAEVAAQEAAPVPLLALLGHPFVREGETRAEWLDQLRKLDLGLRGPRPAPGLEHLRACVQRIARSGADEALLAWWDEVEAILAPLAAQPPESALAQSLDRLVAAAQVLCGDRPWAGSEGRALARLLDDLRGAALDCGSVLPIRDLPAALRDALNRVAVRPSWGSHPRVAIYGLLEGRLSRADLVICAGLAEGTWPAAPSPEPILPPAVLRALGVPGAEFRIGLAAHDLAGAIGAPEVVLSWARRDAAGPVIPSRFVLRIKAMLGERLAEDHRETRAVELARAIDDGRSAPPQPRPAPCPEPAMRDVALAVTALDRLRADPYQFYASAILRLRKLDLLDAEPTAAWKGTVVHRVLERWHKSGARAGELLAIAGEELAEMQAHPLVRSLWWPRLARALEWIDAEIDRLAHDEGRIVAASELAGEIRVRGVRVHGRVDRIDRLADGRLAIVDYKTGKPPSRKMVAAGNALQLGLLGLIAERGGFDGISGDPARFEYWSLQRAKGQYEGSFGYSASPFASDPAKGLVEDDFLDVTAEYLDAAIATYILGTAPFEASLQPDLLGYNDYDHLSRLDEWQTGSARDEA